MSFKFALKSKTALNNTTKSKPAKRKPLFDDDEPSKSKRAKNEEEILEFDFDETAAPVEEPKKPAPSKSRGPPPGAPPFKKKEVIITGGSSAVLDAEERVKEAMELDPTIFDYDAAYDVISAAQAAKTAAQEEDALQRRPKYMENLFESAEVRKKDLLRARDKLVKREREAEGDEFADKEKFVTGAYKQQQEETRKAEEEEKERQKVEDEKRRKTGMQSFHRRMLMEEEKRHEETMKAAAELAKRGPKPAVEAVEEEKTAEELAKEMLAKGKKVVMNDDGFVTDKRQLLSVGLNVVAKPKNTSAAPNASSRPSGPPQPYKGRNAVQKETRERQTQMIAEQIEQAAKRAAEEEAEAQRKIEESAKSRKTAADVMSAKERYLQRKKEAAAAKAAGK